MSEMNYFEERALQKQVRLKLVVFLSDETTKEHIVRSFEDGMCFVRDYQRNDPGAFVRWEPILDDKRGARDV